MSEKEVMIVKDVARQFCVKVNDEFFGSHQQFLSWDLL